MVARVKASTRVWVTAHGRLLYDGVLVPGRNEWKARERIVVWVERPEAVEFEENGKRMGTLGEPGNGPVQRVFGREE